MEDMHSSDTMGSRSSGILSISTGYSSTTRSSGFSSTTTRSTGFMSTGPIEEQATETVMHVEEVKEVNIEKEKHFDDLVQEFFVRHQRIAVSTTAPLGYLRGGSESWASGGFSNSLTVQLRGELVRPYAAWSWMRALTEIAETSHSARSHFPDRSSQHARFTQETVLKMLPFVDLIVATTDEAFLCEWEDAPYKKLKTLLAVRDALSMASSKIRLPSHSTPSEEVERIQGDMVALLSAKNGKVAEAIWNTMDEVRRGALKPMERAENSLGAQTPGVSPIIYNVTRSVISYVMFLRSNYSMVAPVLYEAASLGKILTEIDNTNPLSSLALEMFTCMEEKLTQKSQSFPDQGLRLLFLINNSYLIQQLLHRSVSELVPESHMQTLAKKIEGYIQDYLQASWAPVLSCLYCTTSTRPLRNLRFGRDRDSPLARFGKEFQKTYSAQKLWPVRNPELRKKLRKAIADKVISGLTQYLVDNNITTRGAALQETEEMLQEIFEG